MTNESQITDDTGKAGVLGKLKCKLDRMLGRKECNETFDIKLNDNFAGSAATRKSFRVSVSNMEIVCRDPRIKCKVSDVSADGVGFLSDHDFGIGSIVEAVLLWSGKPILKKLKVKIIRQHKNIVGCCFQDLTKEQDIIVSKIVLAAQKKAIKSGTSKKIQNPIKSD